tara:strand:+ start:2116 stop:2391 length:276 start_codon:yes stop_codon:yes gene_type:complete
MTNAGINLNKYLTLTGTGLGISLNSKGLSVSSKETTFAKTIAFIHTKQPNLYPKSCPSQDLVMWLHRKVINMVLKHKMCGYKKSFKKVNES